MFKIQKNHRKTNVCKPYNINMYIFKEQEMSVKGYRDVAITAILQMTSINAATTIFLCFFFLKVTPFLFYTSCMCTMLIWTEASRFALNKPKQTANERAIDRSLITCVWLGHEYLWKRLSCSQKPVEDAPSDEAVTTNSIDRMLRA